MSRGLGDVYKRQEVNIPNIYLPDWMSRQPNVDHLVPPVVLNIGNPIVDIPGCVKMHRDNQYHNNGLPIDRNLVENDPDQAMIVCDAEVPSYDAMNYEPEQLIIALVYIPSLHMMGIHREDIMLLFPFRLDLPNLYQKVILIHDPVSYTHLTLPTRIFV